MHVIPGQARYDVILLSFGYLEHLLTRSKKVDIIHAETKSDMHGFYACFENLNPAMAGFRLYSEGCEVTHCCKLIMSQKHDFGPYSDGKVEWKAI